MRRRFSGLLLLRRVQPIYVAIETTCRISAGPLDKLGTDERVRVLAGQAVIQNAQRELVDEKLGIRAGPNLDLIPPNERWDTCHLDAFGQRTAVELWRHYLTSVTAAVEAPPPAQ